MKVLSYFTFCLQGWVPCAPWRHLPPRFGSNRLPNRREYTVLFLSNGPAGSSSPMAANVSASP